MKEEEVNQDLRIRTKHFALRIIRLYSALPKKTVAQVIGKQMLRSGTSVGANYREAYRARSNAEFIAKLGICRQELEETFYWQELLVESGIMPTEKLTALLNETDQLIAIFTTIIKKGRRTRDEGRGTKGEGRRTRDEGRGTRDEGRRTRDS